MTEISLKVACAIAAAVSMLVALGVALGQGFATAKSVEAISRQPEAAPNILTTMVLGLAIAETATIFAFVLALILVSKI